MKIRIGNIIYYHAPTGWQKCGYVRMGIDGEYIEWLA